MRVHDIVVPPEAEARALMMLRERPTGAAYSDVVGAMFALVEPEVNKRRWSDRFYSETPSSVTARAADRLLQRERKAGRAAFVKGRWFRVEST